MNMRWVGVVFAAAGMWQVTALAVDTVVTSSEQVRGRITQMSPLEVTVETAAGPKTVPVNQILRITYDAEPAALGTARSNVETSRFEDALTALDRIPADSLRRPEIAQDVEFYRAYCRGKIALGGTGSPQDAGSAMVNFLAAAPNSYHYWDACRMVAELLIAVKNYDNAVEYFGKVADAPWPEYKVEGLQKSGWTYILAGKFAEAEKAFDQALAVPLSGDDSPKLLATIGKARTLVEKGQTDEAIAMLRPIPERPDLTENSEVMGRLYGTLGAAYRKAGKLKDAVIAFLHVDLLYFSHTPSHIDALRNLAELWPQLQHPERAAEAVDVLKEQYKVNISAG